MARTGTAVIKDMVAGQVAGGTRLWYRVADDKEVLGAVDAYDAWVLYDAYDQDRAQWVLDNPDTTPPNEVQQVRPATVADRDDITIKEKVFLEVRFFTVHDGGEAPLAVNIGWLQVIANVPGLTAGFWSGLTLGFNAARALTPYAP